MTASSSVSVGINLGDMPTAAGAAGACRCNTPVGVIEFAGPVVIDRFVLIGLLDANVFSFHLPTGYVHFVGSGGDL